MLRLTDYFSRISHLNYAVTKWDVPYIPEDFPKSYPIGKDLDLYVDENDLESIKTITKIFLNLYKPFFDVRVVDKATNVKYRLEKRKKLHYQFDIEVDKEFLLQNRRLRNSFWILSLENEIRVRKKEVSKNPKKLHHVEWLEKFSTQ